MIDATAKDMIVGNRFELDCDNPLYPSSLTAIKKNHRQRYMG